MLSSVSVAATRPWRSADSGGFVVGMTGGWVKSDFSSYDDQSQIEMCLACPFADDCRDCVTRTKKRRGLFRRKRARD